MPPELSDDPYYQNSQLTHQHQSQPDSLFRLDGQPQKEQIFLPSPGKNTLVCAASLPSGVKAKVRLLVWKGKLGKWCLDDTYSLPPEGEIVAGAFTWVFKTAGHLVALWIEEITGGEIDAMEAVLVDHNAGGC